MTHYQLFTACLDAMKQPYRTATDAVPHVTLQVVMVDKAWFYFNLNGEFEFMDTAP